MPGELDAATARVIYADIVLPVGLALTKTVPGPAPGVISAFTDCQEKEIGSSGSGASWPEAEQPSWRPVNALFQLRAVEALAHREFRLLWLGARHIR